MNIGGFIMEGLMNNIPQTIFPDDKIFKEISYVNCYSGEEAERIVQNIKDHFKDKVEIEIVIDTEWYKCFIDENGKDIVSVKCNNGNLSYNSLLIHGKLAKSKLWYISEFKFDIYMKKLIQDLMVILFIMKSIIHYLLA